MVGSVMVKLVFKSHDKLAMNLSCLHVEQIDITDFCPFCLSSHTHCQLNLISISKKSLKKVQICLHFKSAPLTIQEATFTVNPLTNP